MGDEWAADVARILGAHVRPARRDRGRAYGTATVAVMVDRRLKSHKMDEILLTEEEAVALAAQLLAGAMTLKEVRLRG